MKLKRLGFLSLALVLLLGTMGIGYSMWFQTITIDGTVNTGNVTICADNYSGTWAWKDLDWELDEEPGEGLSPYNGLHFFQGAGYLGNEILPADFAELGASTLNNPDLTPEWINLAGLDHVMVGFAEITAVNGLAPTADPTCCENNSGIAITAVWKNLFPVPAVIPAGPDTPFLDWCVDFDLTNNGSIPVKFVLGQSEGDVQPTVSYSTAAGAPVLGTLEGYQLEPGESIHVLICIDVNEETEQGVDGSFTMTIYAVQWNEYGQPIPTIT